MSTPPQKMLSILLVEDSPADGRLLMEALKPAVAAGELVIQTVRRLGLAIETLKGSEFSCILLDLGLPDGCGVESVRMLREVDHKTAIVVLTGLADEQLALQALRLGAQEYLVKGESDGAVLLRQLRRAVQRNRLVYAAESQRETSH